LAQSVGAVWANPDGNRNVGYLNGNASKRNCNLNWDNPDNPWNPRCVFAVRRRKSLLGIGRPWRELQLLPPPAEHLTYFIERFAQTQVFFIVERPNLPGDLQEELESIEFSTSSLHQGDFLWL
jgi:hypothetical protein